MNTRPTVGLAMIVKDNQQILPNCLRSALPYVDELVIVDTGSSDDTINVAWRLIDEHRALRPHVEATVLSFTSETHPESFLLDVPETWNNKLPGPYTGKMMFADFGAARQFGWSRLKSKYGLWLDSDDVLEGGANLAALLVDMEKGGIETAMINYDYTADDAGNVTCRLSRERIMRLATMPRWMMPVHEVLFPKGMEKTYPANFVSVRHRRNEYRRTVPGSAPQVQLRNLKILTKWFESHPEDGPSVDPRMLFYIAMEERFIPALRDSALRHFKRYCQLSGWDEERGTAHMVAGSIYEPLNRLDDAFAEFAQAAVECRWNADPWFSLARMFYFRKDWGKCIENTEKGFRVLAGEEGNRESTMVRDPLDRTYRPYIFYSAALVNTGQYERAIEACKKGLEINQGDPHLKGNLEAAEKNLRIGPVEKEKMVFKIQLSKEDSLEARSSNIPDDILIAVSLQIWKKILETDKTMSAFERAVDFLRNLPPGFTSDPKIQEAKSLTLKKIVERGKALAGDKAIGNVQPATGGAKRLLKIGIWTGWAWEPWSPASVKTGIGGSETAAICMARELAKAGHHVQAYANCEGMEGFYDGVEYIHWQKAWDKPDELNHDVLVVSRQVQPLHRFKNVKSKILWVHDINVGSPAEVGDSFDAVDKIFCLSEWHKGYFVDSYPILKKSPKVIVTRNGIDLDRFEAEPIKQGNRLIYTSSPDRGLEKLLELFPHIRAEVPNAELHVYYGFKTWTEMAKSRSSLESMRRIQAIQDLMANTPGVVFHDRVGQKEIADAFLASKIWSYPTWFTETSCITAMEAQAAGCIPVTSNLAALSETVKAGILIKDASSTPEYAKKFVHHVVRLLHDEKERSEVAKSCREQAFARYSWASLVPEWEKNFIETLAAKAAELIPGRKFFPQANPAPVVVATSDGPAAPSIQRAVTPAAVPRAVAPATDRPMRIAVILGKLGAAVHGKMDVDNLFDSEGSFVTGTVSGFFNIAWGLGERGHVVDAFCDAKESVVGSRYGGVNFYTLDGNTIDGTYDAYVSVNEPDLLRNPLIPEKALKVCAMWLNDFGLCYPGWDEFVDVYACPSQSLIDHLVAGTAISRSKMSLVPLSINAEFYDKAVKRRPFSMAYSSSPDRGLHVLLDIFPEIRKRVPGAELRIYYRFKPWLDQLLNDSSQVRHASYERAVSINDALIRFGQKGENGITLVGPLPPRRLIDELRATRVLAYPCSPTRFTEGFSSSVMDACMAGCVPVIAGVDALPEVYGGAAHVIHGDAMERREEWIEALSLALTDDGFAGEIRQRATAHAMKFTRQKVAEQWERLLRKGKPT